MLDPVLKGCYSDNQNETKTGLNVNLVCCAKIVRNIDLITYLMDIDFKSCNIIQKTTLEAKLCSGQFITKGQKYDERFFPIRLQKDFLLISSLSMKYDGR